MPGCMYCSEYMYIYMKHTNQCSLSLPFSSIPISSLFLSVSLSLPFFLHSPSMRRKLTSPTTTERMEMLSPAARKLINRTSTPGSLRGLDKALRASYTPTRTPSGTHTHTPQHRHTTPGNVTPSLSDNLLKLK